MLNDVWTSEDGADWTQLSVSAEWSSRAGHTVEILNRQAFLMGGSASNSGGPYLDDVWYLESITTDQPSSQPTVEPPPAAITAESSEKILGVIWIASHTALIGLAAINYLR